jgi:membrane associated rhomboid family serine protease
MLEDRQYMRQAPTERRRSATTWLLIANVAAFLLECLLYGSYPPSLGHSSILDYLALSPAGIRHGFVWQLVTFQFMHSGLWHLGVNCWVIYMFGLALEDVLGRQRFLALYFFSGVVGGVVQTVLGFLAPHGQFAASVIGASAGALGLLAAYATLNPELPLVLIFPPMSIRAKYLLWFFVGLAAFGMVFPVDNLANAAHLGGIVGGVLFVRAVLDWNWHWPRFRRARPAPARRKDQDPFQTRTLWPPALEGPDDAPPADDFVSREVDPILDKISAHGIQSLTERERRILEKARARMARR